MADDNKIRYNKFRYLTGESLSMKNKRYQPYVAAGITAFLVVSGAIILNFLITRHDTVFAFCASVAHILRPIFMGMVLAFLLLPVHRRAVQFLSSVLAPTLTRRPAVRKLINYTAILFSLFMATLLIYILLAMLLPQIYWSIVGFIQEIPSHVGEIQSWLRTFLEDNPAIQSTVLYYYSEASASLQQWLSSDILPNLESAATALEWIRNEVFPSLTGMVVGISTLVSATTTFLTDLLIAVIASVYLLARKDIFAAQSKKIVYSLFPTKWGDMIVAETRSAYRILSGFINGKLLDSLIIGIICFISCHIFDFPYPTLVATIIGVTNVIPFFGPFIGAVPCSILILLVSPVKCVYFVLFILALQQFDGNILGPKILGDSTGLASFWVLFSILLFGGLFGFAGMVLGVPVFAMLYSITRRLVYRGLRKRGLPIDTSEYIGKTGPLANISNHEEIPD